MSEHRDKHAIPVDADIDRFVVARVKLVRKRSWRRLGRKTFQGPIQDDRLIPDGRLDAIADAWNEPDPVRLQAIIKSEVTTGWPELADLLDALTKG